MASNTNIAAHGDQEFVNKLQPDFNNKRLSGELLRQQPLTEGNNSQLADENDTFYSIISWSGCVYLFICGIIFSSYVSSFDTPKAFLF